MTTLQPEWEFYIFNRAKNVKFGCKNRKRRAVNLLITSQYNQAALFHSNANKQLAEHGDGFDGLR